VFLCLAELFAFAGRFDAHALRNAVLDAFFERIAASEFPYANARNVYAETASGSSLHDLVVDMAVHAGRDWSRRNEGEDMQRVSCASAR
jgi:hypothetical protein